MDKEIEDKIMDLVKECVDSCQLNDGQYSSTPLVNLFEKQLTLAKREERHISYSDGLECMAKKMLKEVKKAKLDATIETAEKIRDEFIKTELFPDGKTLILCDKIITTAKAKKKEIMGEPKGMG